MEPKQTDTAKKSSINTPTRRSKNLGIFSFWQNSQLAKLLLINCMLNNREKWVVSYELKGIYPQIFSILGCNPASGLSLVSFV